MYTVQAKSAKAPKSGTPLFDFTKQGENCGACVNATHFDRFASLSIQAGFVATHTPNFLTLTKVKR